MDKMGGGVIIFSQANALVPAKFKKQCDLRNIYPLPNDKILA